MHGMHYVMVLAPLMLSLAAALYYLAVKPD
ncbi:hypothetical protein LCGC14_0393410 [marine sediment metagenome]|uniref:Uncharacterized protein n=1 Tax=marine sediment metagenome TaxID=412755 RepID=A0A0F9T4P2_9ZZZZ